ncbi:hypothetical protein FHS47_001679 [Lutibacter sp. SG786]|nr:hypothetical protein [Luteibacter sp. SG786]
MTTEAMLRDIQSCITRLERLGEPYRSGWSDFYNRCAELIRTHGPALVEAVRDAERYKHIRDATGTEGFWIAHGKFGKGCSRWTGEAADHAIDQARAEGGE